ncbi:FG-GAP-like repeat-containing protein [Fuerstiella marisgermanici]|uniref:BsSco n=1 Tax=Fuerstiella marisgermanici TaxID=1891926 RepID=A0A1P8WHI5_9PLAN|nr:FG-GAP-like repeat-containing protein [Fuerstiella marisgermanici]APZ93524.1 BsSco [Fuerstiella marisgermanici]
MRTLIALILLAPLAGCSSRSPDSTGASGDDASVSVVDKPPVLMPAPDFVLTDQSGQDYGSDDILGRACIVNFFFTRCQETCPLQTARLAELQEKWESNPAWNEIRMISITVDPAHDTPDVLMDYAKATNADTDHWKFLTGPDDAIKELTTRGFRLPVEEAENADGASVAHSPQFVLVGPEGYIRGFYDSGSTAEIDQLETDVFTTLEERLLYHQDLLDPAWVEERRDAQFGTTDKFSVFHDFGFFDRRRESGITFRNRIVDDAGREHKPCHYDHGTGVAIADVDGDGLQDLYFVTQVGGNELWKNQGDGTFQEMTRAAGVAVADRIGVSASFADIDNDGDADLYVTNVRSPNVLFQNDGTGKFTDISSTSGIDYSGHSSSAVFFDYNRDGRLDLFLVNVGEYTTDQTANVVNDRHTGADERDYPYKVANPDAFAAHLKPDRAESSILFENQGGNRFVDVSSAVGLEDSSWSGDASPLDVNEDGWPDLYVLNMQGHDEYYENDEGRRFVKKSREVFPATPWGAMGIKVFDFDNDGRLDIYLTDMHTDMSGPVGFEKEKLKTPKEKFAPEMMNSDGNHVFGNAFFQKQKDGTYREISDRINAETYWPWGLSVGDLNADGFEDVFVAGSMNFPFRYAINSVLLNNEGREFLDAEYILGIEPRRANRTAIPWFELDVAGKDRPLFEAYRGRGAKVTRMTAWGALGTRSSVIFDMDKDGDLDIITNDFNSEPMVLVSNLAEQEHTFHYLKVDLTGNASNRDGLGALVTVRTEKQSCLKVNDGKSGYLSQSSCPLYFGLGPSDIVNQIEVQWPSGQSQTVDGPIAVDRLIEITEPDAE